MTSDAFCSPEQLELLASGELVRRWEPIRKDLHGLLGRNVAAGSSKPLSRTCSCYVYSFSGYLESLGAFRSCLHRRVQVGSLVYLVHRTLLGAG